MLSPSEGRMLYENHFDPSNEAIYGLGQTMYEGVLHKTREAWLMELTERLSPVFEQAGWPIPEKRRISVGWPSEKALAPKNRVIGQCWPPVYSTDRGFDHDPSRKLG